LLTAANVRNITYKRKNIKDGKWEDAMLTTCMVNKSNVTRCTSWQSSKHTKVMCVTNITLSNNLQLFRLCPATISVHRTYNRKITVYSVIQEDKKVKCTLVQVLRPVQAVRHIRGVEVELTLS